MKTVFMTCLLAMIGVLDISAQDIDILPDTWVATDALGRVMPNAEEAQIKAYNSNDLKYETFLYIGFDADC